MHPEEATKFYKDLKGYKPVMHDEPDGSRAVTPGPVSDGLESYDARVKASGGLTASSTTAGSGSDGLGSDSFDDADQSDPLKPRTADEIRAAVLRKARESSQTAKLQQAKSEHERDWDATSKDAHDTIQQSKIKIGQRLTGQYTRDFPEEFAHVLEYFQLAIKNDALPAESHRTWIGWSDGPQCTQLGGGMLS